jgi:hypothetical protein
MKLENFNTWVEQRIVALGSSLIIVAFVAYIVSQFVPVVNQWLFTRGFFNVLLVALVVDMLRRVITLKMPRTSVQAFQVQDPALDRMKEFITTEHPTKCDLIEYSTGTIRPLLGELKQVKASIRILICHPNQAINPSERKTIETGIFHLRQDFKHYKKIEVRQYLTPASLRGRYLGDKQISVGWYLYSHDDGEVQIRGRDTAMLLCDAGTEQGRVLQGMFTRAFKELWDDPKTVKLSLGGDGGATVTRRRA